MYRGGWGGGGGGAFTGRSHRHPKQAPPPPLPHASAQLRTLELRLVREHLGPVAALDQEACPESRSRRTPKAAQ